MSTHPFTCSLISFLIIVFGTSRMGAQAEVNYDEANVPSYELPDPLFDLGKQRRVNNAADWENTQRPYWLKLFSEEMYGDFPEEGLEVSFILESSRPVFDDKAIRKEVTINVKSKKGEKDISLLIYLPKQKDPAPVFLGLNFYGNHTINPDPEITIHRSWGGFPRTFASRRCPDLGSGFMPFPWAKW